MPSWTSSRRSYSAATMRANQLRLWLASFAYVLMHGLRRIGLGGTRFARATCGSIRTTMLKIGALVTVSVRDGSAWRWRPPVPAWMADWLTTSKMVCVPGTPEQDGRMVPVLPHRIRARQTLAVGMTVFYVVAQPSGGAPGRHSAAQPGVRLVREGGIFQASVRIMRQPRAGRAQIGHALPFAAQIVIADRVPGVFVLRVLLTPRNCASRPFREKCLSWNAMVRRPTRSVTASLTCPQRYFRENRVKVRLRDVPELGCAIFPAAWIEDYPAGMVCFVSNCAQAPAGVGDKIGRAPPGRAAQIWPAAAGGVQMALLCYSTSFSVLL